jgi:uncharacterized delta-60 repeat protein
MRFSPVWKTRQASRTRRRRNAFRPRLELLEDRSVPSTGLLLGSTSTAISSNNDIAYGVDVQTDGKIVAVGTANSGGHVSASYGAIGLVGYNSDLSLDTTFGNGGIQTTQLGGTPSAAHAMAIQADGGIVAAGFVHNSFNSTANDFAVARYTTAGVLDTSFGGGKGYVTTNVAGKKGNDLANAVALDGSGRIVAADSATDSTGFSGFAVARYTASGTLDTTFNSGGSLRGTVISHPIANTNVNATSVAIQSDGKIVVGGFGASEFILERFNTNGTLDTSFGSGGIVLAQIGAGEYSLGGVALDASGRIIVAGSGSPTIGSQTQFLVARFSSSGALDANFNGTGYVFTNVFPNVGDSQANAVVIEANGDIGVAGGGVGADTYGHYVIVEYTPNGSLDTTFNATGIWTDSYTNVEHAANAVALDAAGNFVIAGETAITTPTHFAVAVVDPPAGGGGVNTLDAALAADVSTASGNNGDMPTNSTPSAPAEQLPISLESTSATAPGDTQTPADWISLSAGLGKPRSLYTQLLDAGSADDISLAGALGE